MTLQAEGVVQPLQRRDGCVPNLATPRRHSDGHGRNGVAFFAGQLARQRLQPAGRQRAAVRQPVARRQPHRLS